MVSQIFRVSTWNDKILRTWITWLIKLSARRTIRQNLVEQFVIPIRGSFVVDVTPKNNLIEIHCVFSYPVGTCSCWKWVTVTQRIGFQPFRVDLITTSVRPGPGYFNPPKKNDFLSSAPIISAWGVAEKIRGKKNRLMIRGVLFVASGGRDLWMCSVKREWLKTL